MVYSARNVSFSLGASSGAERGSRSRPAMSLGDAKTSIQMTSDSPKIPSNHVRSWHFALRCRMRSFHPNLVPGCLTGTIRQRRSQVRPSNFRSFSASPPRSRLNLSTFLAVGLVMGLLLVNAASAQTIPTATLSGNVRNDALDLPGVTVTAKSPDPSGVPHDGHGQRAAITSSRTCPPANTRSRSRSRASSPRRRRSSLGRVAARSARREPEHEPSRRRRSRPGARRSRSLDPMAATTYTGDLLSKLPTARTITSAVLLSPGVNENGPNGVSISGAQSTENLYTVNGVVDHGQRPLLAEQPLHRGRRSRRRRRSTSSVSAEYGRFTGGVINTITKSGGNAFSGSFRTTLDERRLGLHLRLPDRRPARTRRKALRPEGRPDLRGDARRADPEGHALVLRGRAATTTRATRPSGSRRFTNIAYTTGDEELRYEGKLTFSPLPEPHPHGLVHRQSSTSSTTTTSRAHGAPDLASFYDRQLPTGAPRDQLQRRPHELALPRGPSTRRGSSRSRTRAAATRTPPRAPSSATSASGSRTTRRSSAAVCAARRNATTTTTSSRARTSSPRRRSARTTSSSATTTSAASATRTTTSPAATASSTLGSASIIQGQNVYPVLGPGPTRARLLAGPAGLPGQRHPDAVRRTSTTRGA